MARILSWVRYALKGTFRVPETGYGILYVWKRNFLQLSQTFMSSLSWIVVEPLLYLLAIGYGLGQFVEPIEGQIYVEFFLPGLMAMSGFVVSFYETTYGASYKFDEQGVYRIWMLGPVSADELALGEILCATFKGLVSILSLFLVGFSLGLLKMKLGLFAFLLLALLCWASAAAGLLLSSLWKSYQLQLYAPAGLIIPMSLFCGTYFPLEVLPQGLRSILYLFPLTYGAEGSRILLKGHLESFVFLSYGMLFLFCFVITNWSCLVFTQRMEKYVS